MPTLVKPPPGTPLRADAPFASDLLDFWPLREPNTQQAYRSIGKARSTLTLSNSGFAAIQSGPIGPEYRLDTGSTGYAATTTTLPISAPPFTLFCAARIIAINSAGRSLIGLFDASITNGWSIVALGYNAVSDNRFGIRLGATFTNGTNLGSLASNIHGVVLKVPAVGSNATIYGNGSLWGTSSNTVPSFTASRLCLGNYAGYGGYAGIQCAGIIGRLLSDAEAIELSSLLQQDPHYLVRPRRSIGWLAAATLGGASYTASATIAGVGALSATAVREQFPAATIAGTGALSAGAIRETFGTATLAGVGDVQATATREAIVSATIAGVGSLSATALYTAIASATIAGVGSLSATAAGVNTYTASATIAGTGGLSAGAIRETFASTSLAGVGALSATAGRETFAAAALAGTSTIAASAMATGDDLGPLRDYHLLADAVSRLEATGLFDGVYLASPGEYAGQSTFITLAFVYQTGFAWDDQGTTGDEADVYRTVEYRVAIIARDPDPTRRYARLDQAGAAASNALSGVRLADASMPAMTRLRMGRYVAFPPPLGGLELRGEAQRIVAGYQANDDRDDIDDLDP